MHQPLKNLSRLYRRLPSEFLKKNQPNFDSLIVRCCCLWCYLIMWIFKNKSFSSHWWEVCSPLIGHIRCLPDVIHNSFKYEKQDDKYFDQMDMNLDRFHDTFVLYQLRLRLEWLALQKTTYRAASIHGLGISTAFMTLDQ